MDPEWSAADIIGLYPSWVNQLEFWFATVERDSPARGIVRSVADLRRQILRRVPGC